MYHPSLTSVGTSLSRKVPRKRGREGGREGGWVEGLVGALCVPSFADFCRDVIEQEGA